MDRHGYTRTRRICGKKIGKQAQQSHPVWGIRTAMANGEVEIHTDVNRPCCRSCRTRAFVKLKSTSMDSRRVGQVASSASCIEVSFSSWETCEFRALYLWDVYFMFLHFQHEMYFLQRLRGQGLVPKNLWRAVLATQTGTARRCRGKSSQKSKFLRVFFCSVMFS